MRRITDRTLIVGFVLLVAVAAGAYVTLSSVTHVEAEDVVKKARYEIARRQYEETVGAVEKLADKASSQKDWEEVLARAQTLPGNAKDHFARVGNVGMLESLALERDRTLVNAGELYAANQKDPTIPKVLESAKKLQELADSYVQKLSSSDLKDPDWLLALRYRKAYEKYRSLAFLEENDHNGALEIIDEAMSELRAANLATPKNNRVEVAIEFLYKRAKEEESKRGDQKSAGGRPRALPSRSGREPGPGDQGKGMGPKREQRF
jgi:hypothetical protein